MKSGAPINPFTFSMSVASQDQSKNRCSPRRRLEDDKEHGFVSTISKTKKTGDFDALCELSDSEEPDYFRQSSRAPFYDIKFKNKFSNAQFKVIGPTPTSQLNFKPIGPRMDSGRDIDLSTYKKNEESFEGDDKNRLNTEELLLENSKKIEKNQKVLPIITLNEQRLSAQDGRDVDCEKVEEVSRKQQGSVFFSNSNIFKSNREDKLSECSIQNKNSHDIGKEAPRFSDVDASPSNKKSKSQNPLSALVAGGGVSKGRKSDSDPVSKLLGGRMKQIGNGKKKGIKGYTVLNFNTEIDPPDVRRLIQYLKAYKVKNTTSVKPAGFCKSLCKTELGSIMFCKKDQRTIFDRTGPGIPLYFIFIKTLIAFLVVSSIMAIFMVTLNLKSFTSSTNIEIKMTTDSLSGSFNNFLIGSTLSGAKSKSVMTYTFKILDLNTKSSSSSTSNNKQVGESHNEETEPESGLSTPLPPRQPPELNRTILTPFLQKYRKQNTSLKLVCESGKISTNNNFTQFGLVSMDRSHEYIMNFYDIDCTDWNGFQYGIQHCEGLKECEVQFKFYWLKEGCQNQEALEEKNGLIKLFCMNSKPTKDASDSVSMRSYYTLYYEICIAILAVFMLTLLWLILNEYFFMKQYKEKIRSPSEFCLELGGLPKTMNEHELCNAIYQKFDNLTKDYGFSGNPLVDIQIAHSQELILLSEKLDSLKISKQAILIKLKENLKNTMSMNVSRLNLAEFSEKIKLAYNFASVKRKKELAQQFKLVKKIRNLVKKEDNLKSMIHKTSKESMGMKSAFVTFQRIKHKNYFKKMMRKGCKHRLFKSFGWCKDEKLLIGDRMIYAVEPPEPINVVWSNYSYSNRAKLLRRILSWTIYIALYSIPLITFYYFESQNRRYLSKLPSCPAHLQYQMVTEAWLLKESLSIDELKCFCIDKIDMLTKQVLEQKNAPIDLCASTKAAQSAAAFFITIESILISIISTIFDYLYQELSLMEAYTDKNANSASLIVKYFFWKYLNVGIFPLLFSLDLHIPLLNRFGFYDDLTPYWYKDIGLGIMIGSISRIFVLGFVGLVRWGFYMYKIGKDRGWSGDISKTKTKTHNDYKAIYKSQEFDIELCYSEILTSMFVLFTYGFMMPLLFITTLFQLIVLFFRDKFLNIHVYFFFSQFNENLHSYTRTILDYTIMISVGIIVFIFGNIDYFPENNFIEAPKLVAGHGNNFSVFFITSKEVEPPSRKPNLYNLALRRMNESIIGNLITMLTLGYCVYLVINLLVGTIRNLLKVDLIEAGIEIFANKRGFPEIQFEDLVTKTEIVCQSQILYHNKGRMIGGEGVIKMHNERMARLRRNFKRKKTKNKSKGTRRRSKSAEKSDLGGFGYSRKTTAGGSTYYEKCFMTTSSYDYRLHPDFKQMFIKRMMTQIVTKVSKEDAREKEMRRKVFKGGVFSQIIQKSSTNKQGSNISIEHRKRGESGQRGENNQKGESQRRNMTSVAESNQKKPLFSLGGLFGQTEKGEDNNQQKPRKKELASSSRKLKEVSGLIIPKNDRKRNKLSSDFSEENDPQNLEEIQQDQQKSKNKHENNKNNQLKVEEDVQHQNQTQTQTIIRSISKEKVSRTNQTVSVTIKIDTTREEKTKTTIKKKASLSSRFRGYVNMAGLMMSPKKKTKIIKNIREFTEYPVGFLDEVYFEEEVDESVQEAEFSRKMSTYKNSEMEISEEEFDSGVDSDELGGEEMGLKKKNNPRKNGFVSKKSRFFANEKNEHGQVDEDAQYIENIFGGFEQ